jgi:hypothetical protein
VVCAGSMVQVLVVVLSAMLIVGVSVWFRVDGALVLPRRPRAGGSAAFVNSCDS